MGKNDLSVRWMKSWVRNLLHVSLEGTFLVDPITIKDGRDGKNDLCQFVEWRVEWETFYMFYSREHF